MSGLYGTRQNHPKGGAAARGAFHLDVPADRAKGLANLISPYSHTLGTLRTVERLEKSLTNEVDGHPYTVIEHLDDDSCFVVQQPYVYPSVGSRRVLRVPDSMGDRH